MTQIELNQFVNSLNGVANQLGLRLTKNETVDRYHSRADAQSLGKAQNFVERFREVVSDPLNMLIERVPNAGYLTDQGNVILHNGVQVPIAGDFAYYKDFSEILLINRGVHEPLEEYCFQELLKRPLQDSSDFLMLELGAYWGHYSMWLKTLLPQATTVMVEPNITNLNAGKSNFSLNGMSGQFIHDVVAEGSFTVDNFCKEHGHRRINILHSDIQGAELFMLQSASETLGKGLVDYLFISTHSNELHENCMQELQKHNYVVEFDSNPDSHSTSYDGFFFARHAEIPQVFEGFVPKGRTDIANATTQEIASYLKKVSARECC